MENSENALSCLVEELWQAVYVADIDTYEMLYMNRACREQLHCDSYSGKKCYEAVQGLKAPCPFCTNAKLKKDAVYCWEHENKMLGMTYQLQDHLIDYQGHRARIEVVFDVSEHIFRENELQTVLETQRELAAAIQIINGKGTIEDRLNGALKNAGEYFQADRAYIFLINQQGSLDNIYEWCRDGVEPQIENLQDMDIHSIDRWMPYFKQNKAIVTPDIEKIRESRPEEYRLLKEQDIRSTTEAPLYNEDQLIGFVGLDNPAPEKIENTAELLLSVSYAISNAYIRAVNEQELRESKRRYELAEEAAELGVWEYRIREHRIVSQSHTFKKFGVPDVIENVPESILGMPRPEDREKLLEMFRKIEEGVPKVSEDFWMNLGPNAPQRCEHVIYNVVKDENGKPSVAYGVGINVTDQKKEEEDFRHTIQSLFTANPESLCTFRVNLTKNSCQEVHGISRYILDSLQSDTVDGIIENTAGMISIPEERAAFLKNFSRKMLLELFHEGKSDYSVDYRRRAEDGKMIWVRTFARMLRNPESGDTEGIIYSLNVTKDKYRDRAFRIITDREYDYEAFLDPKNHTIRFLNLSSRLLPKYQEKLGKPDTVYPYEEVCRFAAGSFIAAEDREFYLESCRMDVIAEHLEKDGYYEYQVRGHYTGKPDEFMYRRLQYYYLDDSRDTILLVQSDVTNAVLRQKKENEYVEDIIDSVSAGIVSFRMPDADHLEGIFVNLQMFRILGLEKIDGPDARKILMNNPLIAAYMKNAFIAVHPDDLDRVRKAFHDGYDKEYFNAGNYRILKQDGSPVWINQEAILREIRPDGHIFYASYRVVEREVELQAKLEKQLENEKMLRDEADSANAAKTDFLSRMSHDIRTPLNGIIGMTYLTRAMDLPEKAQENLRKIDTSSKFLLGLINDILDMSKAESGKIELHPEPYPPEEFSSYMQSVIMPLVEEKEQTINYEIRMPDSAVPIQDKLRINQVVFNILSNAVKFTPEGGKIRYTAAGEMNPDGSMHQHIEVSDSGIGMSEEFQRTLFNPFTQENRNDSSEQRGTGLGMAITKQLVERMGGTIRVESRIGKGTTFYLDFPSEAVCETSTADRLSADEKTADRKKPLPLLAGKHILLCEDHPLNLEIAKALLEDRKVIVSTAEDGKRAAEMFRDSPPRYYDAVLMDIRMPIMDGYEATGQIRAMEREDAGTVPIIAMTADAFTDDIQKCIQAGMNGHIAKPIDPHLLYKTLSEMLAQ
ncbi:MAG: ATP-binding protein [Lachnospiraceae bacterium]|jgi:signal transduction histidine kinase/ActR/RegA family two-component response regulator|nr:ATP-binding protein [Lachnospiraceae bacterium]